MLMYALTLCMCSGKILVCMCLLISCNSNLSRWLFWVVGCFNCIFIKDIELRLSVKMYVGFGSVAVSFNVSCMAISSAQRMFCSPWSLVPILMFFSLLYIPYPTMS
jgi:hypothetical protein